jgi:hypothetical protein
MDRYIHPYTLGVTKQLGTLGHQPQISGRINGLIKKRMMWQPSGRFKKTRWWVIICMFKCIVLLSIHYGILYVPTRRFFVYPETLADLGWVWGFVMISLGQYWMSCHFGLGMWFLTTKKVGNKHQGIKGRELQHVISFIEGQTEKMWSNWIKNPGLCWKFTTGDPSKIAAKSHSPLTNFY